jgi:hypothetical protein
MPEKEDTVSNERRQKLIVIFSICMILVTLTSCTDLYMAANRPRRTPPPSPGLYSLNGWYGTRGDADVNGEVGHPLSAGNPTANCVPSQHWSGGQRINSGVLPPGMSLDNNTGAISGLPSERGHWIVQMELYNVQCGGQSYLGFTQTLRFHITGSGKVVE